VPPAKPRRRPCHKSNAPTPTESAIGEFETILYDAFGTQIG
jgi:hypothetical protein